MFNELNMKVWFERVRLLYALALGFQFCWEDSGIGEYRLAFDLGRWRFNICFRLGGKP